jgi:DUF1009 family protein
MTNKRDELGWRIPREGTKSHEIYLLMIEGKTSKQITSKLGRSSSPLISKIKKPELYNLHNNKYYKKLPKIEQRKLNNNKSPYSKYVRKLVKALGISFTEAKEIERKELEKQRCASEQATVSE